MLCAALPKSGLFAVVCIGLADDTLLQAGLFSLGSVLSCSLWSVLVWSTLPYIRLDLAFLVSLFFYSLVWFKLVCAVCCALAGLVKQHGCGIKCSGLSHYVGRGHSVWFGLLGYSFRRFGLTVWSWSRLSVRFCPCWSGGARTVLVWSSWYTWSGLVAFAHLVCTGLVDEAQFQAGMLSLRSVLSRSLWSCVCSAVVRSA